MSGNENRDQALLQAELRDTQHHCCIQQQAQIPEVSTPSLLQAVIDYFLKEEQ